MDHRRPHLAVHAHVGPHGSQRPQAQGPLLLHRPHEDAGHHRAAAVQHGGHARVQRGVLRGRAASSQVSGGRGEPWLAHGGDELAERFIETEAAMMLSYRVVTMQAKGLIPNYESSAVKLYAMELAQRIANTGRRLLGVYGLLDRASKWAPLKGRLEYQYLRSVANTIEGGTSEIQRNIVATRGLGLPRSD